MRAALDSSPDVAAYRQAAAAYGLEYTLVDKDGIMMAGYDTPIGLAYAKAGS
jgi:hypothetical protein